MVPAVVTAFLYALSAVCSQRATRIFGPLQANAARLTIACVVLGFLTWTVDAARNVPSLHAEVWPALLWSGLAGFGLGDVTMFLAYPKLGSRLTLLTVYSAATLFAAAGDWWLLGEPLRGPQWTGVAAILGGLGMVLWPDGRERRRAQALPGIILAVLAGFGQALGTVLSGRANGIAAASGVAVHGISQAFQRSVAGAAVAVAAWLVVRALAPALSSADTSREWRHRPFWLGATALCGPVIGVSCYQWARLTVPSAVVVAVAATSTLLVIPLARAVEKDVPGRRQVAGTLLAAAGVVWLCLRGG